MTIPETSSRPPFASVLWTVQTYLGPCQETVKQHGYIIYSHQVCFNPFCTLFTHRFFMEQYVDSFISLERLCVLFFIQLLCLLYISNLNALVFVKEFILSFFPLCFLLVYHGYINVNIGPSWMGTRLNIFSTTKNSNKSFGSTYYVVISDLIVKCSIGNYNRWFWRKFTFYFFLF